MLPYVLVCVWGNMFKQIASRGINKVVWNLNLKPPKPFTEGGGDAPLTSGITQMLLLSENHRQKKYNNKVLKIKKLKIYQNFINIFCL